MNDDFYLKEGKKVMSHNLRLWEDSALPQCSGLRPRITRGFAAPVR